MRFFLSILMVCLVLGSYARAEGVPDMDKLMPPELLEAKKNYDAAYEKLTEPQKAEIAKIDEEMKKALAPDVEILSRGVYLEVCLKNGLMVEEDGKNFLKFRDHQNKNQESMWADVQKNTLSKIDFMDKSLVWKKMILNHGERLKAQGTELFAKRDKVTKEEMATECPKISAYLTKYVADNNLAAAEVKDDKAKKDKSATINLSIPPDVSANAEVYNKKLATLPPEQKAQIEKIVKDGGDVSMPYNELLIENLQLNSLCLPRGFFDQSYKEKYEVRERKIMASTKKAIDEYRNEVISKIDYMDQDVVFKKIGGDVVVQNQLVTGMFKVALESITPEKARDDCQALRATLDGAVTAR